MKNYILLLLLATFGMQAQTYQNPTYGKLKLKTNTESSTAEKVNVQETDGTLNWQFIKDFQNNKPYFSTGLLKNGLLTINADNTKFDLSAGIGVYSDFTDPENVTSKVFNFPAFSAVVSPYLATSNITYVAVNYNGGSPVLVMQASPFLNTQVRDLVVVGAVIHSNFATINTINNISSPSNDVGNSVADIFNFLGARNQEGNVYSANGANLQLNKSAGVILKYGANFHVNAKNPHNVFLPEQLSLTFRYRLQGGFEGTDRINVDVDNYDLNNVLTAVPPNKYTIQTIFIPQTGQTRIQYGQTTYNTLADAIAAINTRKFNVETNLATQFVKVAYLVLKKGTTSLQVVTDSDIIQASKFDATASGGVAITYQSIIDALGFTPENIANKVIDISTGANNTTYPSSLAVKTYADNLVVGMLNDRGSWDASVNLFPTTGGSGTAGAIRKGDMWYVSVSGILGGKTVNVGDSFRALVNSPAQTAANWSVLEANIGYVPENVANKTSGFSSSSTITYPNTQALVDGLATKENTFSKNTAFNKNFGTTAGTVAEGSDSRFTDSRNPLPNSTNYIQNQNTSAQAANMWISGISTFGEGVSGPVLRAYNSNLGDNDNISISVGSSINVNNSGFLLWQNDVVPSNRYLSLETFAGANPLRINASNFNVTTSGAANFSSSVTATSFNGSATLTGTPTAPTATAGTNTTQIATTAFVLANSSSIPQLESNATDLTVWNNGKGNFVTNTGFGDGALKSNMTGGGNTANGFNALQSNTTGNSNTVNGANALDSNTIGSGNTANGFNAGNLAGAININNGVFIGGSTRPLATTSVNEIAVGQGAIGAGSNTATLGNASIVKTVLGGVIQKRALDTAPSSATDTGTTGEIRITSTYIYVCTATNTWVRTALATW